MGSYVSTTIFFATDVHGSEICWKKFISAGRFYGADVIILGGDMTGKAVVPIVQQADGRCRVELLQQLSTLDTEDEVDQMVQTIKSRGYYPYRTTPYELAELQATPQSVDAIFADQVLKTATEWIAYVDEKLEVTGIQS